MKIANTDIVSIDQAIEDFTHEHGYMPEVIYGPYRLLKDLAGLIRFCEGEDGAGLKTCLGIIKIKLNTDSVYLELE